MSRRIVFMGTPPFAVASLNALIDAGMDVAAVVTAPDRPAGRGQHVRMSAVKERALELGIPILQPERLKDPAFHAALDATGASLYVVVAFRMLPALVWQRPSLGTINLHASLLPRYRGAAPINWAIIHGEVRTGVTTFFIKQEIDTGDILQREPVDIGPEETAGDLHDRLMTIGAGVLTRTVKDILDGRSEQYPQEVISPEDLRHAPKLTPANCRIDINASTQHVHDHIRGLSPHPGAWSQLQEVGRPPQHFKVLRAHMHDAVIDGPPGRLSIVDGELVLQCADGRLRLLEVQAEGKRRMDAAEFARGLRNTSELSLG
jgi:methionyl-tRNA formyltransferase